LADVAVWNTILTADEIKAIYEISSTGAFLPTRNYDLIGSSVTPPYTGSYGSTLQGINVTTFERFGMSVAPKMGRSDKPKVLLSSSAGVIDVTPENNDYFDASLRLPEPISFTKNSGSNQTLIGDDDYKVIELPQYILNHQAYGLEELFVERDPFVEMDVFNPVIYISEPMRMAYPCVMENPSPIDPFDFNGVIEPFALRRPLAGFSTFIGNDEDPEPTGMDGSVGSGMMQSVFYRKSVLSTNFYYPTSPEIEPFEQIGAEEEYDEAAPASFVATGSLFFENQPNTNDTLLLSSSDGTAITYKAVGAAPDYSSNEFEIRGTVALTIADLRVAIEPPYGHQGKIVARARPEFGADVLRLFQGTAGLSGNTVISSSLTHVTSSNFSGGTGIWKPIHAYVKALPYMTDMTSSLAPFIDETSPEDAFYEVSDITMRKLLEALFTKASRLGVPSRMAKSAGCGWDFENSQFGIDSLAFGGRKK